MEKWAGFGYSLLDKGGELEVVLKCQHQRTWEGQEFVEKVAVHYE